MAAVLKETPSGFSLLNGYVIQYDTLRLVSFFNGSNSSSHLDNQ